MCEEGNLPVCHISCGVVHFLCLQEMTSMTFRHAWLEPWQPKPTETLSCVYDCVCLCVRETAREQLLMFFVCGFFHVSSHVWVLVCISLARVCTSIRPTNLWLMCAICVHLPTSYWDKWSHIILRKPLYHKLCFPTRGCVPQLEQMM